MTMPVRAAEIGATPVRSPTVPAPRDATAEYHRTNAAAVTSTARYATAAESALSNRPAADGPSTTSPSTPNITAPIQTECTETPQAD